MKSDVFSFQNHFHHVEETSVDLCAAAEARVDIDQEEMDRPFGLCCQMSTAAGIKDSEIVKGKLLRYQIAKSL